MSQETTSTDTSRATTDDSDVVGYKLLVNLVPLRARCDGDSLKIFGNRDGVHVLKVDGEAATANVGCTKPSHVSSLRCEREH